MSACECMPEWAAGGGGLPYNRYYCNEQRIACQHDDSYVDIDWPLKYRDEGCMCMYLYDMGYI